MMKVSAMLFAYAGFAALSLAMSRHFQQIWHRTPRQHEQLALRAAGWVLVATSLALCVKLYDWPMGLVAWIGMLTAALMTLVCLLAYRPLAAGLLACVAPMVALLLLGG